MSGRTAAMQVPPAQQPREAHRGCARAPVSASQLRARASLCAARSSGRAERRRAPRCIAVCALSALAPQAAPPALLEWLAAKGLRPGCVAPGPGGLHTTRAVQPGEVLLEVPDALAVTTTDVAAHPVVAPLAEGRGELVGLALWLIAERSAGEGSPW